MLNKEKYEFWFDKETKAIVEVPYNSILKKLFIEKQMKVIHRGMYTLIEAHLKKLELYESIDV